MDSDSATAMMPQRLPLVPFEKLMHYVSVPNFPNHVGLCLRFRGCADPSAAADAFRAAVEHHPLPAAKIDFWRQEFVLDGVPQRELILDQCAEQSFRDSHPAADDSISYRFAYDDDHAMLTMFGPHTFADGVGGFQILSEWCREYHNRTEPTQPVRINRYDSQQLLLRGRLNMWRRSFLRKLPFQAIAAFGATKFLWRRITSFVPLKRMAPHLHSPLNDDFPCLLTQRFEADRLKQLKQFASRNQARVDDVIAAVTLVAIGRIRERLGWQEPSDWLRLICPLTVRTVSDRRLSACNRVSFVQIDRRPAELQDIDRLVQGIEKEINTIRRWELDRTLLLVLKICAAIPGQIQRMAQSQKCRATALFSFLGAPVRHLPFHRNNDSLQVGNLQLFDVQLLPPIWRLTPISFVAFEFLDQLCVNLHVDTRMVPLEEAEALMRTVQEVIDETCRRY